MCDVQVIQNFDGEMAHKAKELMGKHTMELAELKAQQDVALSEVCILWGPNGENRMGRGRGKVTLQHAQARSSQQRYSERHREASEALQAAKDRADAAQDQVKYLKDVIADQDEKLHRMGQQVQSSDQVQSPAGFCSNHPHKLKPKVRLQLQETEKRLQEQQKMFSAQTATTEADMQSIKAELTEVKEQLAQASRDNQTLRQRQSDEMDRVEQRVKLAIQRKDETIASLRSQLAELSTQMQNAESILTLE